MQKMNNFIRWLTENIKASVQKFRTAVLPMFAKLQEITKAFTVAAYERSISLLWNVLTAYLTLRPKKQPYESTMGHIYIRDFPTAVMPIRRENAPAFRIRLTPENPELEQILIHALADRERDRRDLTDAVSDFIEDLTRRLLVWGDSSYRIKQSQLWCAAEPRYKSFELDLLAGSTFNWGLCHVHCVNRRFSDQVYLRGIDPSPTFLRNDEVFTFVLPKKIFTRRQHKRMVKALIEGSGLQPHFVLENMSKYFGKFNYSDYHRASTVEMIRTLKNTGASINFIPDSFSSEYYRFDMFIRFYGAVAILRESIIEQLNDLLERMGMQYSLSIEGLPLPQQATESRQKLFEGTFDFRAACDLVQTP